MAKDTCTVDVSVNGDCWPKAGFRKAWLRHRLPDRMWRLTFDRVHNQYKDGLKIQTDVTWIMYASWNMACPIFIYRLEVEPAEGVENGE